MGKQTLTKEQYNQQLETYKKILLDNFSDLFELKKYNGDMKLYHKASRMPRNCWLYVSIHPKIKKFTVGIKNFVKSEKDRLYDVHENLPIDLRCRAKKTLKYTNVDTEIKFSDIPDAETLEKVKNNLEFFKQTFIDFLAQN